MEYKASNDWKLTRQQLSWNIPQELKDLCVQRCYEILASPSTNARAKGIAMRQLAIINEQNIKLNPQLTETDQQINITIKEE